MIDYIFAHWWQFWLIIGFVCLVLELTAGDFFITCFAIGALGAAIVSAFAGFYIQLLVFAVITTLCIFFVRPVALRYFHQNEDRRVSNAEALIGRVGTVIEDIKPGAYGRVAIDGDIWKAVSVDASAIEPGAKVKIVGMESITLKVEREAE